MGLTNCYSYGMFIIIMTNAKLCGYFCSLTNSLVYDELQTLYRNSMNQTLKELYNVNLKPYG